MKSMCETYVWKYFYENAQPWLALDFEVSIKVLGRSMRREVKIFQQISRNASRLNEEDDFNPIKICRKIYVGKNIRKWLSIPAVLTVCAFLFWKLH